MDLITLFAIAGMVIFIGFIGEYIFQKTNIPDVIWLMILGAVISNFMDAGDGSALQNIAPVFTTFALIFILFEGALNIDIKKLVMGLIGGSRLSVLNFLLSMFVTPLIMIPFGWGILEGMLLGAIIGGASSAVIIPLTKNINIKPNTALMLTFESAISDVLCIVGAVTIIEIIKLGHLNVGTVIQTIIYSFVIAIAIGILGGLIWTKIHKYTDKFSKSYMITIAAMLLIYSFVEFLNSNGAIACLSFGIIIGNSKKIFSFLDKEHNYTMTPSAKFFFSEISFFLKTFFFVYLGMLINLKNFPLLVIGFVITIVLFLIRPFAVSMSINGSKTHDKDRVFMEILTPKGLAAAVLAQLPLQAGIAHGQEISTIVLSVIMFSILISTIGVFMTEKGKFKGMKDFLDLRKIGKKRRA